jgi:hypothetical protein
MGDKTMRNELDPRIDQWYSHLDKGQRFYVTAINEEQNTVDIQHFDGDLEELSLDEWRDLRIVLSEQPENWRGALDIAEKDDLGTGITDTRSGDWSEPGEDFRRTNK